MDSALLPFFLLRGFSSTSPWLNFGSFSAGPMSNLLLLSPLVSILWIVSSSLSALQFLSPGISCNRPVQTLIDRQCRGFVLALISYMESSTRGPRSRHPCSSFLFPEFPAFYLSPSRLVSTTSSICFSVILFTSRLVLALTPAA